MSYIITLEYLHAMLAMREHKNQFNEIVLLFNKIQQKIPAKIYT